MALTFLNTVLEQQSLIGIGDNHLQVEAAHVICTNQACLHERNEFYAEVIHALNDCVTEGDCCGNAAKSLVEDEALARREWKRLLDRVLSRPIES